MRPKSGYIWLKVPFAGILLVFLIYLPIVRVTGQWNWTLFLIMAVPMIGFAVPLWIEENVIRRESYLRVFITPAYALSWVAVLLYILIKAPYILLGK